MYVETKESLVPIVSGPRIIPRGGRTVGPRDQGVTYTHPEESKSLVPMYVETKESLVPFESGPRIIPAGGRTVGPRVVVVVTTS